MPPQKYRVCEYYEMYCGTKVQAINFRILRFRRKIGREEGKPSMGHATPIYIACIAFSTNHIMM